jgi:hypothetical protein
MPENCQSAACMLVAGIIQGILKSSDLKCVVTSRKLETEKEDKHTVEYLVELEMDENAKWEKK